MDRGVASKRILGALLLLLLVPQTGWAQQEGSTGFWDELALWADIIYTIRDWEKVVWVVTPAFRTDEQELTSGSMSRLATDATVRLPKEWDIRGRYFFIGRDTEVGDYTIDHRIQILLRKTFFRFWNDNFRFRGGLFYERHFRGDSIDDLNVYRTRFEVRGDGIRNEPWGQTDLFFDHARGFFRTRTRIGFPNIVNPLTLRNLLTFTRPIKYRSLGQPGSSPAQASGGIAKALVFVDSDLGHGAGAVTVIGNGPRRAKNRAR